MDLQSSIAIAAQMLYVDNAEVQFLFVPVRGNKGLCNSCLELVMVVEEKEDCDTDGEEEGLTSDDIYSADAKLNKGQNVEDNFKPNKICNGDEEVISIASDGDLDDMREENKVMGKRMRTKTLEYVGWGSKPLIEFLISLGKDTTKRFSQHEVDSIICQYIQEKKLFSPSNRKKILCDESLYSLFRRKSLHKNKIYDLLENHFIENIELSEDSGNADKVQESSVEKAEANLVTQKKQRTESSDRNSQEMEAAPKFQESCFASIVAENVKLVYLRKSLVEQLLKNSENFEHKVVGSFVRVKTDPRDCRQRTSHQLLLVTGIKQMPMTGEAQSEIVLKVPNMPTEVHISNLSEFSFSEEELEHLRLKVEKGIIPKPKVVELERKAKCLHEDITKHWIEKELIRLQHWVDFANEKGWRRQLDEYLNQRELLKKPSEQERLLQQSPKVIPEIIECKTGSEPDPGSHINIVVDLRMAL